MKIFTNQRHKYTYPVVTMGTFDGVHLGHQKLLKVLKTRANKKNGTSIVITYFHHPLETLHNKTYPYLLTERNRKEKLLKKYGADIVLYLDFNREMAGMSAPDFLKEVFIDAICAKEIVVGYDTHFGKNREGNFKLIKKYEGVYNYKTDIIKPKYINNKIVSSSFIREMIKDGDIDDVHEYLGRNYCVMGKVISGIKLGRKIGFPTINVEPTDPNKLLPANGVYLSKVKINDKNLWALTNIGKRPTISHDSDRKLETYIIGFQGNLYGSEVKVSLYRRFRNERKFDNIEKLQQAIQADLEKAKQIIKSEF